MNQSGEPVTQARLASYAHLDIMMTSQVLRTLEKKRLLERASHPTDHRAKAYPPDRERANTAGARLAAG